MSHPIVLIGAWLVGWVLLWRAPRLSSPAAVGSAPGAPSVRSAAGVGPAAAGAATRESVDATPFEYSVVIPCRNEEGNIANLLADLAVQNPAPAQTIVVDDDSEDSTAEIAHACGAEVIRLGELPDEWVGKNWACHNGAERVTTGTLVFLDADVRLGAGAMASLLQTFAERGGLLSVAPWHTVGRPYEWGSVLFGIMSWMGVGFASLIPSRKPAAFGPVIAVSATDYHRIGGHSAVRDVAVEDIELSRRAVVAGVPVSVFGGRQLHGLNLFTYRMYAEGFRSLVQGWSKNIASGASRASRTRSLFASFWLVGLMTAFINAFSGWTALLALVPWLVQMAWFARQTGSFPVRSLLLLPLTTLLFVTVFLLSMFRAVVLRRSTWRGRSVPVVRASLPQRDPGARQTSPVAA